MEALRLQIYRLHDVARKEKLDGPIHQHANLALETRQLGQIDPPPHEPGQQAGETHTPAARQGQRQLCAGRLVSNYAQRTKGIEMKLFQRRALYLSFYVSCQQVRLAECELCGGRTRLAGLCVTYRGAITQRPDARMAGDCQTVVHNNSASPIFLHRE